MSEKNMTMETIEDLSVERSQAETEGRNLKQLEKMDARQTKGGTEALNAVVSKLNLRLAMNMESPDHSLFRLNSTGNYQAVEFMGRELWHKIVDEPAWITYDELEEYLHQQACELVRDLNRGLGILEEEGQ